MTEEREKGILFRGMGDDANAVPSNAEDMGPESSPAWVDDPYEEEPDEEDESGKRVILHRDITEPDDVEERTGLVPKEPFYKDAVGRYGMIPVVLIMIGIPALIFLGGNLAVSAGLITARIRDIVTGVLFLAAVIVLLTVKSD